MKWYESLAFSRVMRTREGASASFWNHMRIGVLVFVGIDVAWVVGYLLHGEQQTEFPAVCALGAGLGIGLGLASYLANEWCPALVVLSKNGIERRRFHGIMFRVETWNWSDIGHCTLDHVVKGSHTFSVLVAHSSSGPCAVFGLPKQDRVAKIEAWFQENDFSVLRDPGCNRVTELSQLMAKPLGPSGALDHSLG